MLRGNKSSVAGSHLKNSLAIVSSLRLELCLKIIL